MLETLEFLGKPFCHDILYIVPYWPFFEMGGLPWTSNPPASSYRVADISGMSHSVGFMWWWGEPITLCIIRGWRSAKSPACPAPDIFDFFEIFLQLYYEEFQPIISFPLLCFGAGLMLAFSSACQRFLLPFLRKRIWTQLRLFSNPGQLAYCTFLSCSWP